MKSFYQNILDATAKAKATQHDNKLNSCILYFKKEIEKSADKGNESIFIAFDTLGIDKYYAQLIVDYFCNQSFKSEIRKANHSADLPGPHGHSIEITGVYVCWKQ